MQLLMYVINIHIYIHKYNNKFATIYNYKLEKIICDGSRSSGE